MDRYSAKGMQQFKNFVGIKFQLYNSLFTSLPFHRIEKTGILLSLLLNNCEEGYKRKMSPVQIIEDFFDKHTQYATDEEKLDMLFRFVQYAERQVVLFDALEDASFREVHDVNGPGTLKQVESDIITDNKTEALKEKLNDFAVRMVLTAHPTQFYPGAVLGIIHDLSKALTENNASLINMYLQQLGKTPFFKKQKPTPYDEAISLVWYLENVFYAACGRIVTSLKNNFPEVVNAQHPFIAMGFWPGGDKDGNPNVTAGTTMKVAEALRGSIIKCYYLETRRIRRRLTFAGVDVILLELENQLYNNIFIPGQRTDITAEQLVDTLEKIREIIIYQHNGLFLHLVENLLNKVQVFGLHFASLDVRQDSIVHTRLLTQMATSAILPAEYTSFDEPGKMNLLANLSETIDPALIQDSLLADTLHTMKSIREIQLANGEKGCNRYIISRCNSALNVMEVFGLLLMSGWEKKSLTVDIVPLFETIDDLKAAPGIMKKLYENEVYRQHLARRKNTQTIMLGFSDGTKDGGYLMANWSIYLAKKELTALSAAYDIDVIFFDGRGGPPARGGGKTHKFYASMGKEISNKEIQLTIQGQTISSNFGTVDSAQYNMEQLLNAGISSAIFSQRKLTMEPAEAALLQQLAEISFDAYSALKNHPDFLVYLSNVSPLRFYGATNIGSRPAKRSSTGNLSLGDLRAIPFVGAWSQLKQNVTGYYGVGTALQQLFNEGKSGEIKALYIHCAFFKTLMDNCEMAMQKCYFPLTQHLASHPRFGTFYQRIYQEYELTKKCVLSLSGNQELMADYPVEQLSIQMRERIVLPLTTIQQFAITKARELEEQLLDVPLKSTYEKLAMRCSFGVINAGRNSA